MPRTTKKKLEELEADMKNYPSQIMLNEMADDFRDLYKKQLFLLVMMIIFIALMVVGLFAGIRTLEISSLIMAIGIMLWHSSVDAKTTRLAGRLTGFKEGLVLSIKDIEYLKKTGQL